MSYLSSPIIALHKLITMLVYLLSIAACSRDSAALLLTSESYGNVEFGLPLAEVEARLQESAIPPVTTESCSFVRFARYADIEFMVENGIVTRADGGSTIANSTGIGVGDDSAELQKKSPGIRITPHKYASAGHYLILDAADGKSALVLEESGGFITTARGGIKPSVEYAERCG